MEKNPVPKVLTRPGFGPRKGGRLPAGQPMSKSRAELLEIMQAQPEPTTLAALVTATGLHANTLREHLLALEKIGHVRRERAEPSGRGRPAWLYEATDPGDLGGRSEYAGLAATLASAIHRTSRSPREDSIVAGTEWGHELASAHGRPPVKGQAAARREVIALLDEIGFAPQSDERASVVKLTRCPLLEAAYRYPDVVCGVHLGIVRGALKEYGADASRSDLFPFSEPGACRLELMQRTEQDRR